MTDNKSLVRAASRMIPLDGGEFRPGSVYIDKNGIYMKILRVEDEKVFYCRAKTLEDDGTLVWEERESKTKLKEMHYYHKPILVAKGTDNVAHIEEMAVEAMRDPGQFDEEIKVDGDTVALTTTATPDRLETARQRSEALMNRATALQRVMERKTRELQRIAREFGVQLKKIQRVIGVLEMYLGVNEEIVQIRDGDPAHHSAPIVIRQRILYMDEETGDPRLKPGGQRGIDFTCVEDFDEWVIQEQNLYPLLPHDKGVVALKPSRQHRDYHSNPWLNSFINANNAKTYLLVRNGDCIYRIWTDVNLGSRLLPSPDEIDKAWERASKEGYFARQTAEDKEFSYRKKALLLQGLIDRTAVFLPMLREVNLFQPETYEDGLVQFVFDDEPSLGPPGRPRYWDWKEKINSQIQRGSRIILSISSVYDQLGNDRRGRYLHYYSDKMNCPPVPENGVYVVERTEIHKSWGGSERERLIILYQPGDEVGGDWYRDWHQRKNRVSFILYREDVFVLNYDAISLDDVEWFINCRYEREDYLEMIPLLWEIRDRRNEELVWEQQFANLVAERLGCSEHEVWTEVEWWKLKNIWKRPIMEDDAKALRMIEARVTRRMK